MFIHLRSEAAAQTQGDAVELRNINTHEVKIVIAGYPPLTLPGLGSSAPRLIATSLPPDTVDVDGMPVPVVATWTEPAGDIPEPVEGVIFITNRLICETFPDRRDLAFPHPVVRFPAGHPYAGQPDYATGLGQARAKAH